MVTKARKSVLQYTGLVLFGFTKQLQALVTDAKWTMVTRIIQKRIETLDLNISKSLLWTVVATLMFFG